MALAAGERCHGSGPAGPYRTVVGLDDNTAPLQDHMRSTRHDLVNNAAAMAARLGAGMVLFVVMGRLLGPAAFGDFMAAMALGAMLAFLANLGLTQQALRELAAQPQHAQQIASNLASAKASLALLVFLLVLGLSWWQGGMWILVCVLTVALLADGAVEFLFGMLKGRGDYALEAGFSTVASLLHFALVGAACWWRPEVLTIALCFMASRLAQFGVALWACGRRMPLPVLGQPIENQWRELRTGWAYALDVGLGQLAAQLDTVLVRALLGSHAAGIYQAGMRVVVGMQMLSQVAGNVFIPRLARALGDPAAFTATASQVRLVFFGLALAAGAGTWILGSILLTFGYGAAYVDLAGLWPWLAGLVATRTLASAYGVELTARGHQAARSLVNVLALAVMASTLLICTKAGLGMLGVMIALLAGALVVLVAYRVQVRSLEAQG